MPITAVLSAFNNEVTINDVVLQTLSHASRVIVVDDGSTDNTAEKAYLAGAEVIKHNINMGKDAALRTGFALAAKNGAKVIVAMDSDGRHDPADIGKLAEPILRGEADLVKGNYTGSEGYITDTRNDFRAFSRKCFHYLITEGNILNSIKENGLKVIEVPIGYHGSKNRQSLSTTRKFTIAAMPAYNEERSIAKMVFLCKKYADLVVVVDDGSADSTADIAQAMGAHVIRHPKNRGYGGALQTCFKTARDLAADRMVIIDADGQHDPAQIPELLSPLNEDFDVVIGSRFINGNGKNVPIYRKIGMKVLDGLTNIGSEIKVTDTQSGLRAYGKKAIENLNISNNNMSAGSEILMQINDHHLKIKEVEIQCSYDVERASTQNPVTYGDSFTKSIGIINHRLNYIALGSIIAVTKNYVDKVYVILDKRDDTISDLALSMGVEVIDPSSNGHTFDRIIKYGKENNAKAVVTLFGDGTHDPRNIKELIDPVRNEEVDVVVDSSSVEHGSNARNNVLSLTKGKAYQETKINNHIGFAVCKLKCLENIKFSNNGHNIAEMMLSQAENNNLKVKYLDLNKDKNFGLLSLYKIGVVVPAYNEELLIEETINGIPKYVERIYIVDDCSKDRTPEIIARMKDPRIVSIRHEKNGGVGAAIISGYKHALKDNMDIVAVMAGDNQMDPEQLPGLLMPIIEGKADYTKGNRLISKDFRSGMSKWRSAGNAMLTFITKIGCGYWHLMDPQNGYTAISKNALEVMDLDAIYPYYGYCNDMLIKLNTFEMRVMDVVMPARYGREKSKIKYSKYIRKVAPMIFRGFLWRLKTKYVVLDFHPLVFFYVASMVLVPVGVLFSMWIFYQKWNRLPVSANYPLLDVFILIMGIQFLLFAMLFDMQADNSRSVRV